jgi:hypothetical protein
VCLYTQTSLRTEGHSEQPTTGFRSPKAASTSGTTGLSSCNSRKHQKTVEEFREYLYRVSPPGIAEAALREAIDQNVLPPEAAEQLQAALEFIDVTFPMPLSWGERGENGDSVPDTGPPLITQPGAGTSDDWPT